jgi:hypothetical protein
MEVSHARSPRGYSLVRIGRPSVEIMPPPSRYDHPYRGRLDVIRTEAALQALCQVQNRPFAGRRSTDITEKVVAKPFSFILTKTNSDDTSMARNGAFCQNGL